MRWLSVLVTASSAIALAAGCGATEKRAEPKIDAATAKQLADQSQAVASRLDAGDQCGAARKADELQASAEEAIAAGHVPPALAGELTTNTQALVDRLSCPAPPERSHGKKKHEKRKGDD